MKEGTFMRREKDSCVGVALDHRALSRRDVANDKECVIKTLRKKKTNNARQIYEDHVLCTRSKR